ncbi:DUF7482 domain-containing protein [Nitrosopumilus ureiphilus]|uniref:DUF7482 domain-containing protein n=1 Tax=Nitrosopumilus ureiphilus TaxID=1470067 RepID=A0A7D5M8W4_9ARCH|nr:hypothetical protein [Nitrosopumilus ureiphilus]QLH07450.1 hypothetical protein C5F50_10505 [Nitrosopumilus ureiphilus]
MNKSLRYIAILALIPLFTAGMASNYFTEADAAKSQGSNAPGRIGTNSYGSANNGVVCGDVLCKDYPGGKAGWEADQGKVTAKVPQPTQKTTTKAETTTETTDVTEKDLGSVLRLSRANIPTEIPMHKGFYNGGEVYYIITDSSDATHADTISKNQGWKVELAPILAKAPKAALSKTYMFVNGVSGDGVHGFQGEVFTSTPAQADVYSALTSHVHVTWNDGAQPRVLDSEAKIQSASESGDVTLTEISVVLNMPQIVWPDGQMTVKEDKTLTDETPYGGGQVLDIDKKKKTVTFIAHRGWGPDGRTIYYIVTDATPSGPANMMGVTSAPTSASLIANAAAVDLYQFKNGLKGSGPLGFQAGIAAGAPGDANYSPMWRIFMIGWNDPSSAQLLETIDDMNAYKKAGLIDIGIARPMDSDHIVNCPFIDPFQ